MTKTQLQRPLPHAARDLIDNLIAYHIPPRVAELIVAKIPTEVLTSETCSHLM